MVSVEKEMFIDRTKHVAPEFISNGPSGGTVVNGERIIP